MTIDTCSPDVKMVNTAQTMPRNGYVNIDMPVQQSGFTGLFSPGENQQLHNIAHDLRNPLGAAYSLLNILLEDDNLNDNQREMLNMAKETTCYSLKLVGNLLAEHRANQTETQQADINTVVPLCIKVLSLKASEKNQQLLFHSPGQPQMVAIGCEKIARVIDNLVSNAIKFTPCGGKIIVTICSTPDHVRVTVQDSGIGIPLHLQHNLFNGTCGRQGTLGEESFGLGLPICKRLIEENGGKIAFASVPGKGSTFYFTLPKIALQQEEMVA